MHRFRQALLIFFTIAVGASLVGQENDSRLWLGVSGGSVQPMSEATYMKYNGGYEFAVSLETSLLPGTAEPWLYGGGEIDYQHFSEGAVASLNAIPATLFIQADLFPLFAETPLPWQTKVGVGWGLFYNRVSPEVDGERTDSFFGIYLPFTLGYRINDTFQLGVNTRWYLATAMVGDYENLQGYVGGRLQVQYQLP